MQKGDQRFHHESLQDRESIKDLLKALINGIEKGKLSFSDGDGEILMQPEGLLRLKLTASRQDDLNRVNVRISWQSADKPKKNRKPLVVKS